MPTPSEEVKSRLDIADVVSGYVKLAQVGANLKGLCPFHHEKTPSFYVSRDRQIWHCFGCGLGGDVFSFVMRIEGMEFPEALRLLADRAGVEIRAEDPVVKSERTRTRDAVAAAVAFYEQEFAAPAQAEVRAYLTSRGLTDETREKFRIGYAPADRWDALVRHLGFKGFRPEELERAGLALRGDRDGSWRDRFHNRIMFPLFDHQGVPVGFSGRHFEPRHPETSSATPAKYVNTPETSLYSKSNVLYGLHVAKDAIREKGHAVLVEGQMDLLLSHQAGVTQAVATSGTALTREQVKLLKRYTNRVHTAFDSDAAGEAATRRSVVMLLEDDLAVHVITVAGGKDPADLVAEDPARWVAAAESARPLMEHYLALLTSSKGLTTPEGKRKAADELLPIVRAFANPVLRGHYLGQLASTLGMNPRLLEEALQRLPTERQNTASDTSRPAPRADIRNRWTDIEEFLLGFLVRHPERAHALIDRLTEELFSAEHTRAVFPFVLQWVSKPEGASPSGLPSDFQQNLDRFILKADRYAEGLKDIDAGAEIEAFCKELASQRARGRLKMLAERIRGLDASQDPAERSQLLAEFHELSSRLQG